MAADAAAAHRVDALPRPGAAPLRSEEEPRTSLESGSGDILIMGILNVTPDSFSDGGKFFSRDAALSRAARMVAEGADIVDVGGESTRPGSRRVSVQEELDRVLPVIEAVRAELPVTISIDTSKPAVMHAACAAGAEMINDVRALREEGALETAARLGARVCLMHMQGQPRTMQAAPRYRDVVAEVRAFLLDRARRCEEHGISRERLLIDPGFGFGKTPAHNLRLIAELDAFAGTGLPVLVGVSRKSTVGRVTSRRAGEREWGSLALAVIAALKGAAVLRVHDVAPTRDAVRMVQAVQAARGGAAGWNEQTTEAPFGNE